MIAIITLIYVWIKKRYNFWRDRGFLQVEGSFPIGSFKGVGKNFAAFELMMSEYKKFKGKASVVGFYTFLAPTVLIIDPDLVKHILMNDFSSFHERGMYHNEKDDPMSAK